MYYTVLVLNDKKYMILGSRVLLRTTPVDVLMGRWRWRRAGAAEPADARGHHGAPPLAPGPAVLPAHVPVAGGGG